MTHSRISSTESSKATGATPGSVVFGGAEHAVSVARACRAVALSRAAYYRPCQCRNREVIDALNGLVEQQPRRGFWKYFTALKREGRGWNHKRVYRVYCAMRLNQKRRTKRRVPQRQRVTLTVPARVDQVWSADFMSDALYHGTRFRTFNVIDDFNREALAIEVDTSLRASRLLRVFERLGAERGYPAVLRVDNGPEFTSSEFMAWAQTHGIEIRSIQPGKPNQNAFIERFNRTYREEVLDLYLFRSLEEVRERSPTTGSLSTTKAGHMTRSATSRRLNTEHEPPRTLLSNCLLDGEAYVPIGPCAAIALEETFQRLERLHQAFVFHEQCERFVDRFLFGARAEVTLGEVDLALIQFQMLVFERWFSHASSRVHSMHIV